MADTGLCEKKTELAAPDPLLALRCSGAYAEEGIRAEPVDPPFPFLFLFFSFFPLFSPFLSLYPRPQEEKTPRVQRVHLPFRDAYCTLDEAIYSSWALPGQLHRADTTTHASFHLERDHITHPHYRSATTTLWILEIAGVVVVSSKPRLRSALIVELSSFPVGPLHFPIFFFFFFFFLDNLADWALEEKMEGSN